MRTTKELETEKPPQVILSDDYAILEVERHKSPMSRLEFYFGYEETMPQDDAEGEAEWAFVVKDGGKETMRVGRSSLDPEGDEPVEFLLCGIGMWIERQRKPAPPSS